LPPWFDATRILIDGEDLGVFTRARSSGTAASECPSSGSPLPRRPWSWFGAAARLERGRHRDGLEAEQAVRDLAERLVRDGFFAPGAW